VKRLHVDDDYTANWLSEAQLPELEELVIEDPKGTLDVMVLQHFPMLKSLDVSLGNGNYGWLDSLQDLPRLETLRLNLGRETDLGPVFRHCKSLRELDLTCMAVS
jgi:hypothetical protein